MPVVDIQIKHWDLEYTTLKFPALVAFEVIFLKEEFFLGIYFHPPPRELVKIEDFRTPCDRIFQS